MQPSALVDVALVFEHGVKALSSDPDASSPLVVVVAAAAGPVPVPVLELELEHGPLESEHAQPVVASYNKAQVAVMEYIVGVVAGIYLSSQRQFAKGLETVDLRD